MTLEQLLKQLSQLSPVGRAFKPQKHLVVLAVIHLIRKGVITTPAIEFGSDFRGTFSELLRRFGGEADRDRPHTPFFHLSSHPFWRLVPHEGREIVLNTVSTVGSAADLQRLIRHAEIDREVFELLRDPQVSVRVEQTLESLIRSGLESRSAASDDSEHNIESLFSHELEALKYIANQTEAHSLGRLLTNLELHDPQSNRYFEVDLVIVSPFGLYVVELKHWSGRVEVRPNSWLQNGSFFKPDPHKSNNFKAKLVRGLYDRQFPQYAAVYVESVVVFTNPEVSVVGASIPGTKSRNPTFDTIDTFLKYLKDQRKANQSYLTDLQCKAFVEYVNKLKTTGPPKDFVFPGYEIVERLYQHADRAEVVARRTDLRHRKLSRLRIFYPAINKPELERRRAHEKATATLNAVSTIGDDPNILKVWAIPNENNYVVEGSDWSETGTLRDVLLREETLDLIRAIEITQGLVQGLHAVHMQSVIHRAVSPKNILIVDWVPKLMNFDLSFQLEGERLTVIPDSGQLTRTPYIAPESYWNGPLHEAADLFSIGVILYEMLTGGPPFGCSTDLEQSNGRLQESHKKELSKFNTPAYLTDLIFDLVQQSPTSRPQTALLVLKRLKESPEPESIIQNPFLKAGDRSGLYAIDEFLRNGAESQIYRATGARGREIALKVFDRDVPLQRVVDEQRFAATVHHPCIVRVDSANQWTDSRYYIPFEWVSEQSLRADIEAGRRPKIDRFAHISSQILDALAALHGNTEEGAANPILHNDIKPDNILFGPGDRPVLIDFGASSAPHVGTYEGTEGYVAPDLRLGQDRKYSEDGDLYALAVTLREWLTGSRSSDDASSFPDIPVHVIECLSKATSSKANLRFSSAQSFREALVEATTRMSAPAPVLAEPVTIDVDDAIEEVERVPVIGITITSEVVSDPNPFVPYLNSLHSRTAETDSALAESQARNPLFRFIHVPHPLAGAIETILAGATRRHVIVTGHAGDGKSTIAVELLKTLLGLPFEQTLSVALGTT